MAANPVIVDFIVRGMPDVQRALRSTEAATAAAERAATRTAARGAAERTKLADQEAKAKVASIVRADKLHQRALDQGARYAEGVARKELRALENRAKETIRIEEKVARDVVRIKEKAAKDGARAEAAANREAARWVKQAERKQFVQERDEMRNRRAFGGAIAGAAAHGMASGIGKVAGVASGVAGMVGQLGGGFGVGDSVQRGVSLKGQLADIASRDQDFSAEGKARGKDKRKSTSDLEGVVRGVSGEFGIGSDVGANALDKFASKTGELKTGMDMLRGLGELSRAGAGSMDDLADAAGDIFNTDKTQKAEDVLQKLRVFAVQGQKGAVEMKDLASQMAKIGAASGRFKDGGTSSLLTMGALAQLARESGGASSAPAAATAVGSLSNQFYKNARLTGMKGLGVDAKGEDGFNKPIEEIIFSLMRGAEKKSRAGGHGLHDFDELMGNGIADAQARKATSPLEAAFKKAGGGDAGIAAAKAELAKFGADPGRDLKGEFATKAKDRMQEDDAKMAKIKEEFDKAVSQKIIPALMKLVPEFERLVPVLVDLNATAIPAFVDLIKTVAEFAEKNKDLIRDIAQHPIGAILAAEVTKSVATAALGEGIKAIIARSFGDAGMGAAFSKVLGSNIGKGGLILATAAIAIQQGMIAIDNEYKKEDDKRQSGYADAGDAGALTTRLINGTATPAEKAKAQATADKLKADMQGAADSYSNPGVIRGAGRAVAGLFSDAPAEEKAQTERQIASLAKTLKELEAAIRQNSTAVRTAAPGGAGAGGAPARGQPIVQRN